MINITGEPDHTEALKKIYNETTKVAHWFGKFIQNYNSLLLRVFLGMTRADVALAPRISIADEPEIDKVRLPYFCPPPSFGLA
jgi:hypothetical protein